MIRDCHRITGVNLRWPELPESMFMSGVGFAGSARLGTPQGTRPSSPPSAAWLCHFGGGEPKAFRLERHHLKREAKPHAELF
jgi:hypothetical protein